MKYKIDSFHKWKLKKIYKIKKPLAHWREIKALSSLKLRRL